MQIEEIFDFKVVKTHCDNKDLYTNKELKNLALRR
jgi:hypothetical protein